MFYQYYYLLPNIEMFTDIQYKYTDWLLPTVEYYIKILF